MTRENKLALVVGFALILFVGILISDHFSTAQNQASANLVDHRPIDPLVEIRRTNPNLIDSRPRDEAPGRTTPAPAASQERAAARDKPPGVPQRPGEPATLEMGGQMFTHVEEPAPANPPFIFHDVKPGESLTSISRRYYGTESLVKELAKFNDIADPNTLRVDQRLRIPAAETLTRGQSMPASSAPAARAPEPAQPKTYTVQSGDTLSEIAQRELGTTRRWREILELNRDVIRDPDNVQVGTVLKLPRR